MAPSSSDLIPPEAVTKLRQKHPGTVRVAEEWRGAAVLELPVAVVPSRSGHLSRLLPQLCKEARDTTFASRALLEQVQQKELLQPELLLLQVRQGVLRGVEKREESAWVRPGQDWGAAVRCGEEGTGPCVCRVDSCVLWYPCR